MTDHLWLPGFLENQLSALESLVGDRLVYQDCSVVFLGVSWTGVLEESVEKYRSEIPFGIQYP